MMSVLGKEETSESSAETSSEVDAAKDILAAIKSNDAKALDLALTRHYEACQGADEGDEADSEEA
jgi:DNA-binding GntR family transcriptional regulator